MRTWKRSLLIYPKGLVGLYVTRLERMLEKIQANDDYDDIDLKLMHLCPCRYSFDPHKRLVKAMVKLPKNMRDPGTLGICSLCMHFMNVKEVGIECPCLYYNNKDFEETVFEKAEKRIAWWRNNDV